MSPWGRPVVFTDLDGTLLDEKTYSFEGARPALEELARRGATIVPCTSKTAAETRHFMGRMGIESPCVVESGGGIHIPEGYFPGIPPVGESTQHGRLIRLAAAYGEVLEGMREIKKAKGGAVVSFHEMTAQQIARETGLPLPLARLAKEREFDEPFRLLDPEPAWPADIESCISRRNLRITRGGRYWHLHGDTDKGRAVEIVKSFFQATEGVIRTVGVGDSAMDLPMLESVEIPIVIPSEKSGHDPMLVRGLGRAVLAPRPGPEAWGVAVLGVLK